jgi:coenzyme F420-dependent glucose-6-phosphate dehydrogenase
MAAVEFGYALSSEEHRPKALVEQAQRAEAAGFDFALISDHYHPWLDVQGQSCNVWPVLGAIAGATSSLRLGTGVTCPIVRTHPAIIAQAAATVADLMPGRFFLGVGTGEALNEHVVGEHWPPIDIRLEMLREAVEVIRKLWSGDQVDHRGEYFIVDNARIYTLPDEPPQIYMAASGEAAAKVAGEIADGLISTGPDPALVEAFGERNGRPRYGQVAVCWAHTEQQGIETAFKYWPTSALEGMFKAELPLPAHFKEAVSTVREEDVAEQVACGPDVEKHVKALRKYIDAGYDHVYVHQIGYEQDGFFEFYERDVLPALRAA